MSCHANDKRGRDTVQQFLLHCSEIDFGLVSLSGGKKDFCNTLNQEVISLTQTLPAPTQADALFLLMKCFKVPFGKDLCFFMNYYVPAWSILYWLIQFETKRNELKKKDVSHAKTAHSMALLLHPIDDHLNDNELPATHLTLLIRSQLWMTMNNALSRLAGTVAGGQEIVKGFLDDYYRGITGLQEVFSLTDYCDCFKNQMATGFIVPELLMIKMGVDEQFRRDVLSSYASFGVAWRILDDINDIEDDMMKGSKSAVYACLSDGMKHYWAGNAENKTSEVIQNIVEYILENRIVETLEKRTKDELTSAAVTMDQCNMNGLSQEYRSLSGLRITGQNNR